MTMTCIDSGATVVRSNSVSSTAPITLATDDLAAYFVKEAGLVCCARLGAAKAGAVGIPHRSYFVRIEHDDGRSRQRSEPGRILLRGPAVGSTTLVDDGPLQRRFPDWLLTSEHGYRELDGTLVCSPSSAARQARDTTARRHPGMQFLMRNHIGLVATFLARLRVPESDVMDVAAEVFLIAGTRLFTFHSRQSLKSWLSAICRERAAAYERRCPQRRKRRWSPPSPSSAPAAALSVQPPSTSLSRRPGFCQ